MWQVVFTVTYDQFGHIKDIKDCYANCCDWRRWKSYYSFMTQINCFYKYFSIYHSPRPPVLSFIYHSTDLTLTLVDGLLKFLT